MRPMHMIRSLFQRRTPPTLSRPFIELMAVRPPSPDRLAHAWGHVVRRSAASLRARARRLAAEQRRLGGGVAGRSRTWARLPSRMAGTFGTSVVAEVHRAASREYHMARWTLGMAMVAALALLSALATSYTPGASATSPEVEAGWSGVGAYSPGAHPVTVEVRARLPQIANVRKIPADSETAVWAGFGGDPTFGGTTVAAWLPQAGWMIRADGRQYLVYALGVVCHSVGAMSQFPGWFSNSYVLPAGAVLTASLHQAATGTIIATLTASTPGVRYRLVAPLPTLRGELKRFPLVEGIVESPVVGLRTPDMAAVSSANIPLVPMQPLEVTTAVTYSSSAPLPLLITDNILQPSNWSDTTRVQSISMRGRTVVTRARITFYRAH